MSAVMVVGICRIIACIVCLVSAYGLMREGLDGWGWMLVLAFFLGCFEVEQRREK